MENNHQPDEHQDNLPKDDASSIEILSNDGDSQKRDSQWSIYSAGRSSIAGSDVSSMDFQKLSIHSKMARIVHSDGRQFLERRDLDDGGLPYSAEFYLGDELWKLNGEDCWLMSSRRYIAVVSVEGTVDLEQAADFDEAVRTLLRNLKLVNVLLDKQLEECNKAKSVLEAILGKLASESAKNVDHKRDIMLLRILLQIHSNSLNMAFKHGLRKCSRLSSETVRALDNYVTAALKMIERNEILGHLNGSLLSDEFINVALQKALNIHRARLTEICPSSLVGKLKELPDDHILCITLDDINLFRDLMRLDQTMFETIWLMIFSKFLTKVQEINVEQLVDLDPLSNRIFLLICQTLQEVAGELRALTKTEKVIIYSVELGWEVTNAQEESQTSYSKCLRQQLQMLVRLANHFEPSGPFRTSHFQYDFKLFQNMDAAPEPVRIWLCLLDDCMKNLIQVDLGKMQMLQMINTIRKYILDLNRQPEYSSFEEFLPEIDELTAWEERNPLDVSDSRLSTVYEPQATDSPPTDPIDFGDTLDSMLDLLEGSISKNMLTNSLRIFTTQFNKYISKTARMSREKKIEQIVSDVLLKVNPQLATSWTEEFKRNELPAVLAGLSAVWSLIVTKNDCSSEKLIKPSCLQISCVLSFFGDQNHKAEDLYKLLHISTQQGKELVVSLTAALLALYGHKVLIVCYNSNLARRNSTNIIEVFKSFAVDHCISYGSVEDMAREGSREVYEKYATYLHKNVGLEIETNHDNRSSHATQRERSVLLIEDIDLLLLNNTLGQEFPRSVRPIIPGLAQVQEKFFKQKKDSLLHEIDHFIKQSADPEIRKLSEFLARPQSYKLQLPGEQTYTNRTLFNKHVEVFKKFKRYVYNVFNMVCDRMPNARLSKTGVVMVKSRTDCTPDFAYYELKTLDFQQCVNGYTNYGFLTLGWLYYPYALMLRNFPLVFCFAISLLDSEEEKTILLHYDIYHKIAKSNPLPTIPVKFDSKKDFLCVEGSIWSWVTAIDEAIHAAIDRNCLVFVFFKSEQEMEEFQSKFAFSLKRLSVTAVKTAPNGENLAEDRFAVDEVTVLLIERKGGLVEDRDVHVIQTFFSDDAKEENLIRRQAERSHGSGSYELILYTSHFETRYSAESVTYDFLVKLRKTKSFVETMVHLTNILEEYKKIESICNTC